MSPEPVLGLVIAQGAVPLVEFYDKVQVMIGEAISRSEPGAVLREEESDSAYMRAVSTGRETRL